MFRKVRLPGTIENNTTGRLAALGTLVNVYHAFLYIYFMKIQSVQPCNFISNNVNVPRGLGGPSSLQPKVVVVSLLACALVVSPVRLLTFF